MFRIKGSVRVSLTDQFHPEQSRQLALIVPSGLIAALIPLLVNPARAVVRFQQRERTAFARCCLITAVGKISIVRNVYKKVGAFIRQVLSNGWISGLNTNEDSSAMISNRHQRVLIACGEVSYESRYQRTSQPVWERTYSAERQQPNLIILRDLVDRLHLSALRS